MKKIACALLFIAGMALITVCDDQVASDCEEANPPAKTQSFGEECFGFYYGNCGTLFHDCVSDACSGTKTTSMICTKKCSSNGDCPGGYYCRDYGGKKYCTPPAFCDTYCDGYTCCNYYNDPADPTECLRGSCW